MPWLEWLKSVFGEKHFDVNVPVRLDFLNNRRSGSDAKVTTKPKSKLIFKNKGNVQVIQIQGGLTSEIVEQLKPIRDAYQNGDILLVTEEQKKVVADVLAHENDPDISGTLAFFKPKLSQHDYQLLRTGLYIKSLRDSRRYEESGSVWNKTVPNITARDKRVINLASAGYFTTYFMPLYHQLKKEGEPQQAFESAYAEAIEEMRFAIFVHKEMSRGELAGQIVDKAAKNLHYGVNEDVIYIHGTGAEAMHIVESSLEDLRSKFPNVDVQKQSGRMNIIKAGLKANPWRFSSPFLSVNHSELMSLHIN